MRADNIWDRFGQPDYAMAFHVTYACWGRQWIPRIRAQTRLTLPGWAYGVRIDPIVLGSQIVMGLQTVVSRTLPRVGRDYGGCIHSGTKHNIISDAAHMQLTVRSESVRSHAVAGRDSQSR